MKKREVNFYSCGSKIVGNLYLPDEHQEGEKHPCIIPCSGFTGVEAVYPALLARALTKQGYACLGFDFRGWAPSEGEVGQTTFESEYEDIVAAYIFAQQQPEVDAENISLFGWSFSGPICIKVAVDNPEIKAVAVGNTYANGERRARCNMTPADFELRKKQAEEDRIRRVLTGKGEMIDCYEVFSYNKQVKKNDYLTDTLTKLTPDIADIIRKNYGSLENFPPKTSFRYFDSNISVDAEKYVAELAPRGLFIVYGDNDASSPYESKMLYKAAGVGKEILAVKGAHNDWMYDDNPEFIKFADGLVKFYDKYMK